MSEEVLALVAMTDMLDEERIVKIADAYRAASLPHARFALAAAKRAGRHEQACEAMKDAVAGVSLFGMLSDCDPRDVDLAAWAARNAGYALATEDLIGTMAYSTSEYSALVDPWFAGFADQPMREREL